MNFSCSEINNKPELLILNSNIINYTIYNARNN